MGLIDLCNLQDVGGPCNATILRISFLLFTGANMCPGMIEVQ